MPGLVLMLLLLLAPSAVPAPLSDGESRYEVRYKWGVVDTKVANASFVISDGEWNGKAVKHSQISVRATPFFRLFMAEEYRVSLYLTTEGHKPLYTYAPTKKKGKEVNFYVLYNYQSGRVEAKTVSEQETLERDFSLEDNSMDLAMFLYYMQGLNLSALNTGDSFPVQLVMPRTVAPVMINYEGLDTEKIPGVTTRRFFINFTDRGLMEDMSGKAVHVWISADDAQQVLLLTVPLKNGVMAASLVR